MKVNLVVLPATDAKPPMENDGIPVKIEVVGQITKRQCRSSATDEKA